MTIEQRFDPVFVGEAPQPFDVTVVGVDGQPVDLTGFTAQASYRIDDGPVASMTAAVHDVDGVVRLSPVEADFAKAGVMRGVAWVEQSGVREAAVAFVIPVRTPPVPIT